MAGLARARLPCLAENTIAAFAEGLVDAEGHGPIEEHLAECGDCRAVLAAAAGLRPSVSVRTVPSKSEVPIEELAPGTRVGRNVVQGLIGRGAMGTVYAAIDPDLDRKVAVKLLRADTWSESARAQMRARLLREAQAMARLSHPEVITVYDVGAFGDQLFVAMEYVDGETLRRWRAAKHRSYAEILDVFERAGSGLAAAHEAGLVHRDFKPDNVLVGRDGRVRVTDFGLARNIDRATVSPRLAVQEEERAGDLGRTMTLTHTGALLGTPAYMAPEQLRGGAADARSDVFSFCVALYEALYGERPFAGVTLPVLQAAIDQGAVRAAPVMTSVPRWVRFILLRGLRAAPDERFTSMRGLLEALRASHAASRRVGRVAALVVALTAVVAVLAVTTRGGSFFTPKAVGFGLPSPPAKGMATPSIPRPADAPITGASVGPDTETRAAAPVVRMAPRAVAKTGAGSTRPALAATSPFTAPPPGAHAGAAPPKAPSRLPLIGNNGAFILE